METGRLKEFDLFYHPFQFSSETNRRDAHMAFFPLAKGCRLHAVPGLERVMNDKPFIVAHRWQIHLFTQFQGFTRLFFRQLPQLGDGEYPQQIIFTVPVRLGLKIVFVIEVLMNPFTFVSAQVFQTNRLIGIRQQIVDVAD